MELVYFDPEEQPEKKAASHVPRVSISAHAHTITFNPAALDKFNLNEGRFINLAEDKARPGDWYIALDIPNTLKLFGIKSFNRPNERPSVKVKNRRLVKQILESIGYEGQGVCVPLGDLMLHGTQSLIPLITRSAYPAKKIKKTNASLSANL